MLIVIQLIISVLCAILHVSFARYNITAVKTADGKFSLLFDSSTNRTRREIPNEVTLNELWFDSGSIKTVDDSVLKDYQVGSPVPSLIKSANNADETMRVVIERAKVMNPVPYIEIVHKYGYFNPSFASWHGRTLMTWGMSSNHQGYPLNSAEEHQGELRFAWLKEGSYHEVSDEIIFGIGPNFFWGPSNPMFRFYEDARLLVLSNNSLLISYAAVDVYAHVSFRKMIWTLNKDTNKVDIVDCSIISGEKNWITFEFEKKIYYIRNVNPLYITEIVADGNGTESVVDVLKTQELAPAGWPNVPYSDVYRGSTPAILVNGVYLAFVHTKGKLPNSSKRHTYFMGALTFCPHYPFHIHSYQPFPIVDQRWYDGPWLANVWDYIVYPAGIMLSPDGQTVYVSNGYQMKDMIMLEFNVNDLFDSMSLVKECNAAIPVPTTRKHKNMH